MSFCSFAENAGMYDVTPIENMFLLEYLPVATGPQLRVYLYARMVCLHPELGDSLEEMAKALHMDVDAVCAAMDFWERHGLAMRMSDRPPTYAIIPMRSGAAVTNPLESAYYEFQELHGKLRALFPESELHAKQFVMVEDWIKVLRFDEAAVVRLVQAMVERSRSKKLDPYRIFAKANENAIRWSQKYSGKAIPLDLVELELVNDDRVKKTTSAVMKQLGMDNRKASIDEIKLVDRWLNEWNFAHDEIIAACAETTKSRTPTLAYLNSVLESRRRGEDEMFGSLKVVLRELGANDTPTPAQIESYGRMLALGFEAETIRLAAVQCSRRRSHRFEDLEWMVKQWADMSLLRRDAAEAYIQRMARMTEEIRGLLEKCGSNRNPVKSDVAYYERWQESFSAELIAYAAECARGMQIPMRYMDTLLSAWQKAGVTTVDDARAQHEAHRGQKPAGNSGAVANPALNYEQRSSTETNYGSTVIDLLKEYGGDQA